MISARFTFARYLVKVNFKVNIWQLLNNAELDIKN